MFRSVDLPLPEGPRRTTNSDDLRSRSTPRRACTSTSPMRYTFVIARASKTARSSEAALHLPGGDLVGEGGRLQAVLGGSRDLRLRVHEERHRAPRPRQGEVV